MTLDHAAKLLERCAK